MWVLSTLTLCSSRPHRKERSLRIAPRLHHCISTLTHVRDYRLHKTRYDEKCLLLLDMYITEVAYYDPFLLLLLLLNLPNHRPSHTSMQEIAPPKSANDFLLIAVLSGSMAMETTVAAAARAIQGLRWRRSKTCVLTTRTASTRRPRSCTMAAPVMTSGGVLDANDLSTPSSVAER